MINCYAAAGKLYGHLREALGFGELVMFTRTMGGMVYQWTFNAKGGRYLCERTVPFAELEQLRSIEAFAEHLSDKWKRQYRRDVSPTDANYSSAREDAKLWQRRQKTS